MGLSVARNKEARPISYHIPCSSWYHHHTVQFFGIQQLNRKFAYCCRQTLMFARTIGIFCCLCFNSYHIPGSSWYTYHFVFYNSTGTSRTAVYVDVRSCFRHLLLFLLYLVPHTGTWQDSWFYVPLLLDAFGVQRDLTFVRPPRWENYVQCYRVTFAQRNIVRENYVPGKR